MKTLQIAKKYSLWNIFLINYKKNQHLYENASKLRAPFENVETKAIIES